MAPRWSRYTRLARGRGTTGVVPAPTVLMHYGDEFDEDFRHDGRLRLAPYRPYVAKVPQRWDVTAPAIDSEPVNPVNQLGPVYAEQIPVVTANDYSSFVAAFDKRSNSQPDVNDDAPAEAINSMRERILAVPCEFDAFDESDDLRSSWMAKFSTEKQKRMEQAMLALADIGLEDPYLAQKSLSVKIEVLLKRNDEKWAPRLIYSSTDEFNALTGPLVNEVTGRLNKMLMCGLGPIQYMMGYKRQDVELASFIDDDEYPHVAEGDYSANDLRQCRSVAYVFDALLEKVRAPSWLRRLFIKHIQFSVTAHQYGMKAELENQLPTGTTITTCRNTLWNASLFSWHCARVGNSGKALTLGDDLLAVLRKPIDLDHWAKDITACKMKLTPAAPALWGEATFLSRRICYQGAVPCMMPKLFKALARFNCRGNDNQAVSDSAYMAGKALCYAYEFRHFPDLSKLFLQRYRSEADKAHIVAEEVSWFTRQSGVDLAALERNVLEEPVTCSSDALVEFLFDAYGLESSPITILQHCEVMILGKLKTLEVAPIGASIDF